MLNLALISWTLYSDPSFCLAQEILRRSYREWETCFRKAIINYNPHSFSNRLSTLKYQDLGLHIIALIGKLLEPTEDCLVGYTLFENRTLLAFICGNPSPDLEAQKVMDFSIFQSALNEIGEYKTLPQIADWNRSLQRSLGISALYCLV